jgi:hypothetical protein
MKPFFTNKSAVENAPEIPEKLIRQLESVPIWTSGV